MNLYKVAAITGFSIAIAAIIGLVRFRHAAVAYRPFFYIVWLGLLNHTVSLLSVYYFRSNAINGNIYVLIESLLYIWLFRNWGTFTKSKQLPLLLGAALVGVWLIDNLILHLPTTANAGFRIVNAFVMVFLSIEQLTRLITAFRQDLRHNGLFLICCGVLVYYSYKAVIEVFFLVKTNGSLDLMYNIYAIMVYINCFVNLLFAWAIQWIPKKNQSLF